MKGWGCLVLVVLSIALWLHYYASLPVFSVLMVALPFALISAIQSREERDEDKKRKASESIKATEERRKKRYIEQQQATRHRMMKLAQEAMICLEEVPGRLGQADLSLRKTQEEFAGGYLIPFWEMAERTARDLGDFDAHLLDFEEKGEAFVSLMERYKGDPPEFPLLVDVEDKLIHSKSVAAGLRHSVRKAHKDEKFAGIYAALGVGQVLIEDFDGLGDAFENLHIYVSDSLAALRSSMDSVAAAIDESRQASSRDYELDTLNQEANLEWSRNVGQRIEKVLSLLEEMQQMNEEY